MADPWRVAQIAVEREPGTEGSRGSGYLIAPGRVLTAAHVVAGASLVRVRLDVGQDTEIAVQAGSWWADPAGHLGTDLAVITIPESATAGRAVELARFGRIRDCAAVLKVTAFGFPLFKLRDDAADIGRSGVFRDLEQATGRAPVAANRRQGTLAVYLDDPPPRQPPAGEPSPWEGMSGAPVLAGGRIVAVVAEHHPSEGTGRLTARRIDRVYEALPAADLNGLAELLGLPPAAGGLPDVAPQEPERLVRSAYLAQVRGIAPDQLIGRDDELADLAEFCAGADAYTWWQAGPWAGKSALASWFVLHPPAGIEVVSFFITGRLSGQADSDAFLTAMIEQLTSLYPAERGTPAVGGARAGEWWDLLASAAEADGRGRRLVVVVDGLDEDEAGATPPRGRPSIASLLPRRPPPGARFIVTSRPDPGLPDDLPSDHPLRICRPHRLPASPVAKDIELRAKQELQNLLTGDRVAIDVVGYIAASGGGLTRSDLSALTGAPPFKLDPVLRGMFGRSLEARVPDYRRAGDDPGTRVYLFAHETLRVTAEEQLGGELARYRQGIHDWICSYASQGWPGTTPGYAISGYLRLLIATSDTKRLSALARDSRRHAYLVRATGIGNAALIEIGDAQRFIAAQDPPDLKALVELAVYRHALSIRDQYQSIPIGLPAAWGRLAYFDHAEALAHTITDPYDQPQALTQLVTATVQAGDPDRAETLARGITDPDVRAEVLIGLVTATAQAGDPDRAEALARTDTDPEIQAVMLTELATAVAQAGDSDRASRLAADAEALTRTHTSSDDQVWAFTMLATAAAQAGDSDRASRLAADAEALVRTITDSEIQTVILAKLATAVAQAGDSDRASRLAADAEALTRTITSSYTQAQVLTELATAAARAGDPDRAEALVCTMTDPEIQAVMLAELATAVAQAGDSDRASRLAADAEALARTMTDPVAQAQALIELATATAQAGDLDRAEALAIDADTAGHILTKPRTPAQRQALARLAIALTQFGDPYRGEALARIVIRPNDQAEVLAGLATVAAQTGDRDRASRLATDAEPLGQALAEVATATARSGELDRGEALARTITSPYTLAQALAGVAAVAAQSGDPDRGEALARAITSPLHQAQALTQVATAAAQVGDRDRASRLAADAEAAARAITDPYTQAEVLAELAIVAAQAGDRDRASRLAADAEVLARTITDPYTLAQALAGLAVAAAQAGDRDRASRLAADAEALARTITDPDAQAFALAGLAAAPAQAGDPDRGEALARATPVLEAQVRALAGLATVAARADRDRASRLAADAEAVARTITEPYTQARALTELAAAVAQAGDLDRARQLVALALAVGAPELRWWIGVVSRFFPSVIKDAGEVFINAYTVRS